MSTIEYLKLDFSDSIAKVESPITNDLIDLK